MKKTLRTLSSSSGFKIEVKKGRYYEIWIEWPEKKIALHKVMRTDNETTSIIYSNAFFTGFGTCYNA